MKKAMCVFVIGFALIFSMISQIKADYAVEEYVDDSINYEELQLTMANSNNKLVPIMYIMMDL